MDLNRRIFNSISILSSNNERMNPRNVLFGIVVFLLQVTLLISSLTYCYRFTANDLENSLYALLQICVFLSAAYTIVVALRLRGKINKLFDQVHQIQIDCEYMILDSIERSPFVGCFILIPGFTHMVRMLHLRISLILFLQTSILLHSYTKRIAEVKN